MKNYVSGVLFGICIGLQFATPAAAGPWEDALAAYQDGRFETAIEMMKPLAEAGDINALATLGDIYSFGEGTPIDHVEALKWSRRGAALGSSEGENDLGVSYAKGQGVPKDAAEAIKWFRKAADHGNAKAQVSIARRYLYGEDVKKDVPLGLIYLHAAADSGNANAQFVLGQASHEGGYGVQVNFKEAARLFTLAAEQGYTPAQLYLAGYYADGRGVQRDDVRSAMWAILAAKPGCIKMAQVRGLLLRRLSKDQSAEAEKLALQWTQRQPRRDRRDHLNYTPADYCNPLPPGNAPQPVI